MTGRSAGEAVAVGVAGAAIAGAVGAMAGALVFGGNVGEAAARGAVVGGASGATVGAMSGDATASATVIVMDPRDQEAGTVRGTVARHVLAVDHTLRILSPMAEVTADADDSFIVERLARRNQLLLAMDDDTGDVLWLGLAAADGAHGVSWDGGAGGYSSDSRVHGGLLRLVPSGTPARG